MKDSLKSERKENSMSQLIWALYDKSFVKTTKYFPYSKK